MSGRLGEILGRVGKIFWTRRKHFGRLSKDIASATHLGRVRILQCLLMFKNIVPYDTCNILINDNEKITDKQHALLHY